MTIQKVDIVEFELDPFGNIASVEIKDSTLFELTTLKYFVEAYPDKITSHEIVESGILKETSYWALQSELQGRKNVGLDWKTNTFDAEDISVKVQTLADQQKLLFLLELYDKYSYPELWEKLKNI